jgi:hypothetical protein
MSPEEPPVEELLDRLPARSRAALEASGFDLPRLRTLAATDPGARQVRHIIAEFGGGKAAPAPLADTRPRLTAHWLLLVLGAAVCTAAIVACDVLVGRPLGLLVAAAGWIGLLALLLTGPVSRRRTLVVALAAAAGATLLGTAVLQAPRWYLAVRGRQATATVEEPYRTWSHGARVAYCRVRLPDGRVRRVDRDDGRCTTQAGTPARVVYDPADRVAPVLGGRSGLGGAGAAVAGAAGLVLLGAAVTAVAGGEATMRERRKDER